MNLRQSPGAQRARQTCYFNPPSSLVSHAQSKSMLLCFLCIYVCVCVHVCVRVCAYVKQFRPPSPCPSLHCVVGWLQGESVSICLDMVFLICVQCRLNYDNIFSKKQVQVFWLFKKHPKSCLIHQIDFVYIKDLSI